MSCSSHLTIFFVILQSERSIRKINTSKLSLNDSHLKSTIKGIKTTFINKSVQLDIEIMKKRYDGGSPNIALKIL
jgi:hypothetical protein